MEPDAQVRWCCPTKKRSRRCFLRARKPSGTRKVCWLCLSARVVPDRNRNRLRRRRTSRPNRFAGTLERLAQTGQQFFKVHAQVWRENPYKIVSGATVRLKQFFMRSTESTGESLSFRSCLVQHGVLEAKQHRVPHRISSKESESFVRGFNPMPHTSLPRYEVIVGYGLLEACECRASHENPSRQPETNRPMRFSRSSCDTLQA